MGRERDLRLSGFTEQYRAGPVEERDDARWETEIAYLVACASPQPRSSRRAA